MKKRSSRAKELAEELADAREALDDTRATYNRLVADLTTKQQREQSVAERVHAAANSVEQARAYVQVAYKEAVMNHQHATSLLLSQELEPLSQMHSRLNQLANLLTTEPSHG